MRKQIFGMLVGLAALGASGATSAALVDLVSYDFTGNSLAPSNTDSSTGTIASDMAATVPIVVASNTVEIRDADVNGGGFLSFMLSLQDGFPVTLTTLSFTAQRSKTQGNVTFYVSSSLDGYVTSSSSYTLGGTTSSTPIVLNLAALGAITDSSTVTFRLNLQSDGTANSRVTSVGNVTLTGDVTAVQLPPAAWLMGSGLLGLVGIGRRKLG